MLLKISKIIFITKTNSSYIPYNRFLFFSPIFTWKMAQNNFESINFIGISHIRTFILIHMFVHFDWYQFFLSSKTFKTAIKVLKFIFQIKWDRLHRFWNFLGNKRKSGNFYCIVKIQDTKNHLGYDFFSISKCRLYNLYIYIYLCREVCIWN